MAEAAARDWFSNELVASVYTPFSLETRAANAVDETALSHRAVALLRGASMLDVEAKTTHVDDDDQPDWWRLEAKLDLILELVGALARRDGLGGKPRSLHCSRLGLCFDWPSAPDNSQVVAAIELHPLVPEPLRWPGEISAEPLENGEFRCWLRFATMPEPLRGAWERHVFRLHRRLIADARRRHQAGN